MTGPIHPDDAWLRAAVKALPDEPVPADFVPDEYADRMVAGALAATATVGLAGWWLAVAGWARRSPRLFAAGAVIAVAGLAAVAAFAMGGFGGDENAGRDEPGFVEPSPNAPDVDSDVTGGPTPPGQDSAPDVAGPSEGAGSGGPAGAGEAAVGGPDDGGQLFIPPPPPTTTPTTTSTTSTTTPTTTTTTTTSTTSTTTSTTIPVVGLELLVSAAPDRSGAFPLDQATVGGIVHVFYDHVTFPLVGGNVRFWIDNPSMTGTPFRVENVAPYDLNGTAPGGDAFGFDMSTLGAGTHTVTVTTGGSHTFTATFNVA